MNLGGHESAPISPLSTLKLKTKIIVRLHQALNGPNQIL